MDSQPGLEFRGEVKPGSLVWDDISLGESKKERGMELSPGATLTLEDEREERIGT